MHSSSLSFVILDGPMILGARLRTKTWWLAWNKVRPCLIRLNQLIFSSKQQRRAKQLRKTKKTSKCKKENYLIDYLLPFGTYNSAYLYNSTLISLPLFKLTPISLQLDLWLTWTLSHNLYLFELLTWSYSDSNSTWSPPQPGFQLNRISHRWTLLGSILAYPSLDSSLLELKVLIPLWTRTPSQFRLVSSIFFLNSSRQLTRVTFTRAPYPIASMLTRPYTFISGRITLLDSSSDQTSTYPALHCLTWLN
jgi:hypothetical protein